MNQQPAAGGLELPVDQSDAADARRLIIDLSSALHRFGLAAHDLESAMTETAQSFGTSASFFATPTSIFITFGELDDYRTTLLRVAPGDVNLSGLCELNDVQEQLTKGAMTASDGLRKIGEIVDAPERYGWRWLFPANFVATATAAVFFGGDWYDVGFAGGLGLAVAGLLWLASHFNRMRDLVVPTASLLVSTTAFAAAAGLPEVSSGIVTVASLILLIPGLSLTIAMNELATQNLASGTARLAGAMSQLLILGFGVALGRNLMAVFLEPVGNSTGNGMELHVVLASLLLASVAFTILFQARPRDLPLICIAGSVAFFGAKSGVEILGPVAGPSLAALLLGIVSNLAARFRGMPASVTLIPGLLLLVPGSMGFKSITELLDHEPTESFESAFLMLMVAAAIVTGLILANVLVPPREQAGRN